MPHVAPAEADDLGRDPVHSEHRRACMEPVRRAGRPLQQGALLSRLDGYLHLRPSAGEAETPGEMLAGGVAPLFLASAVGAATGLIWMLLIQVRKACRSRRQNPHGGG